MRWIVVLYAAVCMSIAMTATAAAQEVHQLLSTAEWVETGNVNEKMSTSYLSVHLQDDMTTPIFGLQETPPPLHGLNAFPRKPFHE